MNYSISRRSLYLIALVISATASAPAQIQERAQGKPDAKKHDAAAAHPSFEATATRHSYGINLDFRHAPEFVLTMESRGREEIKRLVGIRGAGKKPAINIGKAEEVFYFKKKEKRDYGGNKFVAYEFSDRERKRKGDGFDLIIWTEIEAVSPENLAYMKIDRAPFCIVQMVNAAGIQAFPLNRKGAPPEEKFQASGPIRFKSDGKWGYRDPSGERVIIEPKFDRAKQFSFGRAMVSVKDKGYGYIDTKGKFIVEPSLGASKPFGSLGDPDLAAVSRDDKWGIIDHSGKFIVDPKYERLGARFSGGVLKIAFRENKEYRYGYLRKDGTVIVEPKYKECRRFSESMAAVKTETGWGYVNLDGKLVIEPKYLRANGFVDGLAGVQLSTTGKWGFIDKNGELEIEPRFDSAGAFSEGLAAVATGVKWLGQGMSGGKWGYIDKSGRIAIELKFDRAGPFQGGRAKATLDGQSGSIDKKGKFQKNK